MPLFEWSREYSVDIPGLDSEHRQISGLLRELRTFAHREAAGPRIEEAVQQLGVYADQHVRQYPGYAEHKAEHDEYRVKVARLREQLARRDVGLRVSNFLTAWWRHHILTSDQDYARYFQRLLK
jgi:hemerythrin